MTSGSVLALAGFSMIALFMALIMAKRATAIVGLVLIPIAFALLLGCGSGVGEMMLKGVEQVAPTAALLIFAIFYFGIMIDAGLFQPLVKLIVRWVGDSPLKATLGLTALASIVALDGDGTTTVLVCVSAMLPVFRRLNMNPLIFAVLGGLCSSLLNMSPWGGPASRVAAVLKVNPADLFVPLLPAIAVGLVGTFALAAMFGMREQARLADRQATASPEGGQDLEDGALTAAFQSDPAALRPKLIWFNVTLTTALMVALVLHLAPLHALFMAGTALALLVNYPRQADQRERLLSHAGNVLSVAIMVLAAGAFTGVLAGTGMIDAMAATVVATLPREWGPHLAVVTALLSMPLSFFLSNDAYYFGVLPVIAEAAGHYGITPAEIGRASLLGQAVHGLSPLVAALYLKCVLVNVELADLQRFAIKYAIGISLLVIVAAVLSGAIPLARG